MTEMIEKVARAICISTDPDMCVSGSGGTGQPSICYQRAWELHIGQAKAAIEALREPTDEMLKAAMMETATDLKTEWQAMISVALGAKND